ncbi:MAG: hypothetical protein IJ620_02190 [Bacteroidales bacterium]|nr:hypothetical protein [Bacteroidales bacterium]
MKRFVLLVAAVATIAAVACNKEKGCRCSVPGSDKVHHFTIKGGDCAGLNTMEYTDEYMSARRDSLYCLETD